MVTYTSKQILESEDLYHLQDSFSGSAIQFKYVMTDSELQWLEFVKGKYSIYEWIFNNLESDGKTLVFDCPFSMSEALNADCKNAMKAVCLSDDTALQKLFFWLCNEDDE